MDIETLIQNLAKPKSYADQNLHIDTLVAILDEYLNGVEPKSVYEHGIILLKNCYKYKINELYTLQLRKEALSGEDAKEKRKFLISTNPRRKHTYDEYGKRIPVPLRPMNVKELYNELQEQLNWFALNVGLMEGICQTDLRNLEELDEIYPENLSNKGLLELLKTIVSFVLELAKNSKKNLSSLHQFLSHELSFEQKCHDDIQEIDYMDVSNISRQLQSAIRAYHSFLEKQSCRDDKNAAEALRITSQLAFCCYENSLKHHLRKWISRLVEIGEMDHSDLAAIIEFKTPIGRKMDIDDLINKYDEVFNFAVKNPSIGIPSIVWDRVLLREGWKTNNSVKHFGSVPSSAQKLESQIKEIIRFVQVAVLSGECHPDFESILLKEQTSSDEIIATLDDPEWNEFQSMCGNFDSDSYHYIIVVPAEFQPEGFGRILGHAWDMVIDMDPATETNGLLHKYQQIYSQLIPSRVPGKNIDEFLPTAPPYWIRGNGFADIPDSICDNSRRWDMRYGQYFKNIFVKFHSRYTRPLKIIYMPGLEENIHFSIMRSAIQAFSNDEGSDTYGVEQILMDNHFLAEEFDVTSIALTDISLEKVLKGISSLNTDSFNIQNCSFPGIKNNQTVDNSLELEDFCEPVYLSLGQNSNDACPDVRDFYRGARKISWRELALRKDLLHDSYQNEIWPELKRIIAESETPFFTIGYKPGYGGTTLLRRIAWDMHTDYPTLIIHRYLPVCVQRLQALRSKFETVGRLVLLIDSNDMSIADAERLFNDLRINTVPAAIIYLKRRERRHSSEKETFELKNLNKNEIHQMVDRLIDAGIENECRSNLERKRLQPPKDEMERTPFGLAMYAFDKEFVGFNSYVRNFLKEPMQKMYHEFLLYIALYNRIGDGAALDVEFFAYHMDGAKTGNDAIRLLSEKDAFRNMVVFQNSGKLSTCKMRYPGIAEEILKQLTNPNSPQTVNYLELSRYIQKFIHATCIRGHNSNLEDYLKRLLIDRENDIFEGRDSFSRTILDIGHEGGRNWTESGTVAARLVLKTLAECYPDNPHFAGHYGRFLSDCEGNFSEALKVLDRAISACHDSSDCTLLHMKGTIYCRLADRCMQNIRGIKSSGGDPSQEIGVLREWIAQAHSLFESVRCYGASGVTGMLSDIKLCINVIEMGKMIENVDTEIFFQQHINDWYSDLLDRANNLFEECEKYVEYMNPEERKKYESLVNSIMLINKSSHDCISYFEGKIKEEMSPNRIVLRRHLARIYATQASRDHWGKSSIQKTDAYLRIMDLMNDNIQEDPMNTANYRQWFNAALKSKSENEDLVNEALIKVNQWLDVDEQDSQAQLYRYMLTFLRAAIEKDTAAENRLKEYRQKLQQSASRYIARNTDAKFILTHGRGLQCLSSQLFDMKDFDEAKKILLPVVGRLDRKKGRSEATIRSYGAEVFFNPLHTDGAIRDDHFESKALVTYGVLFTYDGIRAHDATVELQTISQSQVSLSAGQSVRCSVRQRLNNQLVLSIHGSAELVKLDIRDLSDPYSEDNIPAVMTDLDVILKYRTTIHYESNSSWGWVGTMVDEPSQISDKPLLNDPALLEYMKKHFDSQ